ncbi:MAG TPA: SusC/RagA family TonB-linked outer membrane protein [Mucilaginibacter sp.]|jgi:TonB-linked SusC/RagA family outer membrane protein
MKLTTLLIIIGFLQVSARGFSQITVKEKNAPLAAVLKTVEKQTGYFFIYNDQQIKLGNISIDLNNVTLDQALRVFFTDKPITYQIVDKNIVLLPKKEKPTLLDKIKTALAVPVTVSGKVQDEQGIPLPGVTVKIKGTNAATITNEKGAFTISVPDANSIITFSFIGFESQELVAKDITAGSIITLKATTMNLKEVVVNKGYYNTTKELNTGDVSSVTAKEIGEQPVSNPLAALQGRVPGLYITQTSGVPGSGFTVRLRGQNSIANGNDPLYIIDGVPYPSTQLNANTGSGNLSGVALGGGTTSPLNYINPSDIETIDVLKDADATAIYGSRGANGVILITTKKGKAGQTQADFTLYQGYGQVTHTINLLNTQQYLQIRHEAFKNDGATPGANDYDLNGAWDTTRNTNWQKVLIGGTAHYTDLQGSVSGGSLNTQFLFGGGYHKETTVFPGDEADQKASVHFNLNHASTNQKFKVSLSINYVNDNSNLFAQNLVSQALKLAPDAPAIYNPDGTLNWQNSTWTNPLSYLKDKYDSNTNNLISNSIFSYAILPELQIRTSLGYTSINQKEKVLYPISSIDPSYVLQYPEYETGESRFSNHSLSTWIIEPQINYHKKFSIGLFDIILGTTFQESINDNSTIDAQGITNDALIENVASATYLISSTNYSDYRYNAIFGRINYNFEDKYLVNLTARRDGSSRFGPGRQFGNFGAIGGAWIFSKEKFISDNLPFLSFGKLRGSYGITGNDQTADYKYLDTYSSTSNPYQNVSGLIPTSLFNANFGWEVNKKLEGGLELGFLQDKILFTASYYRNRSSNQLVGYTLPSNTGFTTIIENLPATVQNTGIELELNTINLKRKNFAWSTSINLSIPRNKLVSYPNLAGSSYANLYVIGQSLFIKELYHNTGIDPQTGLYTFATNNTNGIPSAPVDRQTLAQVSQQFYGGVLNSIQFKGFTFDFLFQFVKQTGSKYLSYFGLPGTMGNQPIQALNYWQKPGDVSNSEQLTQNYGSPAGTLFSKFQASDKSISDASFIRLKNMSLSYELPHNWIGKFKIQNLRIFVQGQNLLTFTNYIGLDPEQSILGNLPSLKILSFGLHVTL